jgi:dihydroflavonol-4-reductase
MKALVTGAAGLIGAHLVRVLLDRGHSVRALVRDGSRRGALAGLPVEVFATDLMNAGRELHLACAGCDVVFHTAAHFAYSGVAAAMLHATAVGGTETVLAACARTGVPRVVVSSSSVVFGYSDKATGIDETAGLATGDGEPPYVAAKIAQHRRALAFGAALRLDVRLACPTMTLGPTVARLGPSNGLIVAYLADPFGCTFPGGCNLVAARDVAVGHALIAQHGAAGESYLLGSANLTWQQIHSAIAELAGVAPPRLELNQTLAFLAASGEELSAAMRGRAPLSTREQAAMVGRYYWYSHAKAAAFGYAPAPARAALIETISWLAASPHISREVRAGMHLADDIHRFRAAAARGNAA